ncbi:MAG: hypothetical protein Q8865_02485 [Bacillota bacterium]|nr:hypothetical protein [Bacillota bacterium]
MDLKNNQITIGEIASNPEAKNILEQEFSNIVNPMLMRMAWNMSLNDVLKFARGRVPQEKIDHTLEELKNV